METPTSTSSNTIMRPNVGSLLNYASQQQANVRRIAQIQISDANDDEDDDRGSMLFGIARSNQTFLQMTNFTESECDSLWNRLKPFLDDDHRRGPKPKISRKDAFLITLYIYKTGNFIINKFLHLRCITRISCSNA
jgi:hypothetical protein